MYKEESSANAALLHNVKEVYMHVFFSLLLLSHIMLIFLTSFLSLAFVVTSISSMGIIFLWMLLGVQGYLKISSRTIELVQLFLATFLMM